VPGDQAADECGGQADRDGGDEDGLVVHGSSRSDGGVRRTGAGPCQNDGGLGPMKIPDRSWAPFGGATRSLHATYE
jgi:hypothetical protein